MNTDEHNKTPNHVTNAITTLGHLREFIATCDVSPTIKGELRSAIASVDRMIGRGTLDLPADLKTIMKKLDGYSPAMAAMSAGGFATTKSRLRRAFKLADPVLAAAKIPRRLTEPWAALQDQLDTGDQRALSKFMYFASAAGWQPTDISDSHISLFVHHLSDVIAYVEWEHLVRATVKVWNAFGKSRPEIELPTLTAPLLKRVSYWIPEALWHPNLQQEKVTFLKSLDGSGNFLSKRRRKLKPQTINQYGYMITTIVSALAAKGTPLSDLKSLADLITPSSLNQALMFLYERAKGEVSPQMEIMAIRSMTIAHWCGHSDEQRKPLIELIKAVKEQSKKVKGLTRKNRTLLDRLGEDPRFRDSVLLLPQLLIERAKAVTTGIGQSKFNRQRNLMLIAVAVEILLVCNVRRENLVELELGNSIRKIGGFGNQEWIIELDGEDVKNQEPLRFILPKPSAALLEVYLRDWRMQPGQNANNWLFTNCQGQLIGPRELARLITKATKDILGVPITPHQFRHIGAELYLQGNPEGIFTVSQHLGHRDVNTTRNYYAKSKQREASLRYQDTVVLKRADASMRLRRRSTKNPGGK